MAATGKGFARGAKRYFVGSIKGKEGLFVRTKGAGSWKLRMLVRYLDQARYKPTLNFRRVAEIFGRRNFGNFVQDEVNRVLSRRQP